MGWDRYGCRTNRHGTCAIGAVWRATSRDVGSERSAHDASGSGRFRDAKCWRSLGAGAALVNPRHVACTSAAAPPPALDSDTLLARIIREAPGEPTLAVRCQ